MRCHLQAIQEEGLSQHSPPLALFQDADSLQADDEMDALYLAGFEWDREECYTRFIVHQKKTGEAANVGGGKKKKGKGGDEA